MLMSRPAEIMHEPGGREESSRGLCGEKEREREREIEGERERE